MATKRKWGSLLREAGGTPPERSHLPSSAAPRWALPPGPRWRAVSTHLHCRERALTAAHGALSHNGRWAGWDSALSLHPPTSTPSHPHLTHGFWDGPSPRADDEAIRHFWTAVPSAVSAMVHERSACFRDEASDAAPNVWHVISPPPLPSEASPGEAPTPPSPQIDRVQVGGAWYSSAPPEAPPTPPTFPAPASFAHPAEGIGNSHGLFRDCRSYKRVVGKVMKRLHSKNWTAANSRVASTVLALPVVGIEVPADPIPQPVSCTNPSSHPSSLAAQPATTSSTSSSDESVQTEHEMNPSPHASAPPALHRDHSADSHVAVAQRRLLSSQPSQPTTSTQPAPPAQPAECTQLVLHQTADQRLAIEEREVELLPEEPLSLHCQGWDLYGTLSTSDCGSRSGAFESPRAPILELPKPSSRSTLSQALALFPSLSSI